MRPKRMKMFHFIEVVSFSSLKKVKCKMTSRNEVSHRPCYEKKLLNYLCQFLKKSHCLRQLCCDQRRKKRGERVNAVHQVHSFLKFEKNKKNSLLQSCSRQEKEGIIEKRTQKKE